MNYSSKKYALGLIALPLLGAGCFSHSVQPLNITVGTLEESRVEEFVEDKPGCRVALNYPVVQLGGSDKKAEMINVANVKALAESISINRTTNLQQGVKEFLDECESALKDGEFYSNPWSVESYFNSYLYKGRYLSLTQHVSSYLGGAHPNFVVLPHTFDLETGTRLSLFDLIHNTRKEAFIREIILTHLVDDFGMSNLYPGVQQSIESEDFDVITDNIEFYLADDGMHLFFNAYAIAPYVVGAIDLTVSLEDLDDYLII